MAGEICNTLHSAHPTAALQGIDGSPFRWNSAAIASKQLIASACIVSLGVCPLGRIGPPQSLHASKEPAWLLAGSLAMRLDPTALFDEQIARPLAKSP